MRSTTLQKPHTDTQNTSSTPSLEALNLPASRAGMARETQPLLGYSDDLQRLAHEKSKPADFAALNDRMRHPELPHAQHVRVMRESLSRRWPYFFAEQHHPKTAAMYDENYLVPAHLRQNTDEPKTCSRAVSAHPEMQHLLPREPTLDFSYDHGTATNHETIAKPRAIRIYYIDSGMQLTTPLKSWRERGASASAKKAAAACLLSIRPPTRLWLQDDELKSLAVATACFRHAFLVQRDFEAAHILRESIPPAQRRTALDLAKGYVKQHDIWPLKDYLADDNYFFEDTTPLQDNSFAAVWRSPKLWPSFLHATALWFFDLVFIDHHDAEI